MPLSNDSHYGVIPMTEAINVLPNTHSIIRDLGIFKPAYLNTTYVDIAVKHGETTLVEAVPRGTPGKPVTEKYDDSQPFKILHLPKDDVVRADDVQNVREFGSNNKAKAVATKINEKLEAMKSDIQYTQEHLMLGALQGKIMDKDGTTVLVDIYKRFGLTRQSFDFALGAATTEVGKAIDGVKRALSKNRGGEAVSGWYVLASPEFMDALIYHKSIKELYARYQDGEVYRTGATEIGFRHKNIEFITYDHVFESGLKIPEGEAIILPKGTRQSFKEYFAPADMNATVNTIAKPYYASREKLDHDKGWSLHAQSNPLPLLLRPDLVATLKMS